MKAEILFVTLAVLVALMFLGLQLINTETVAMGGANNTTAYTTSATAIQTLFVGASAIPVVLMVVMLMVIFYAYMRLVR